ncbi:tetratricopeptide repeat protein [Lentisalinibacter orientalis]|uniref:tetratricopeptide repeat protein n=1 Tax=Lentisalinibacter orientalis TaxID=2992241 RepID=UPI00386DC2CE
MTSSGQEIQRRRGIRASRARLTRALTDAGLRTQAALAERIADLEGLDSAPKDMVSRAFRELPVELQTLERIARALEVEAWTLYRSADEEALPEPSAGSDARAAPRPAWLALSVILSMAALAGVGWLLMQRDSTPGDAPSASGPPPLTLGAASLVVMPIGGDTDARLANLLRDLLSEYFAVAEGSATVLVRALDPAEAAERLRTDAAIDGEIVRVGRLAGLRFGIVADDGVRHQLWAESLPAAEVEASLPAVAERVAVAVRRAVGGADEGDPASAHFPLAPVQDDYLQGRYFLDRPANELNVKRARSHFEAALRQDANYARAHAGLCEALLTEHWMGNEERALEDAARTCGQALQLAPDDPAVRTAHAHFLSRTGRNDRAMALYEEILTDRPGYTDALAGLAASRLEAYRQHGDEAMLESAMTAARAAADSDPAVWKPLFSLATMRWFAGDLDGAIAASEEAIARDENEYVLSNLGTWYVCRGDFERGRDAYLRARELAPQSYVGDEFLGLVYYVLGDYRQSAQLRQRAIDAIATGEPEIHQMWGALADSYRHSGETGKAREAYLRAAEILERDHLRGTAPAADQAARAYYYTMLGRLDPDAVPDTVMDEIDASLEAMTDDLNDATAYRRLAQVWLARGEKKRARQALSKATATCPGYARFPDFKEL